MKESNIGFLSILLGTPPSKDIYSKTQIERDMMEMVSYIWLEHPSIEKDKLEVQNYLN
jgi:hypothetical protein